MRPASHVHDELSEYLNGNLTEARRQEIQAHLAECPACRRDFASLRLTVRALQQLPTRPVPRGFALPRRAARPAWFTWLRLVGGTLAAALVVFVAAQFLLPRVTAPTSAPRFDSGPAETKLPGSLARREAAPPSAGDSAPAIARSVASDAGETGPAAKSARAPLAASSAEAPPNPLPTADQPGSSVPAAPASNSAPAAQLPGVDTAEPQVRVETAASPISAPASRSSEPAGPVWYTPALGLLALLAVVSAAALFILDRGRH